MKSFTTFLTEFSFKSVVQVMLFPVHKYLMASFCLPDKIQGLSTAFSMLYNPVPVLLPPTLPQALATLCYVVIPTQVHSIKLPGPLLMMCPLLGMFFLLFFISWNLTLCQHSSQTFPSLWISLTTTIPERNNTLLLCPSKTLSYHEHSNCVTVNWISSFPPKRYSGFVKSSLIYPCVPRD